MKLSTRLVVLCAVAVLPAVGLQVWSEMDLRRSRTAELHEQAARQAQHAASEIERVMEGARQLLGAVAEAVEAWPGPESGCGAYLAALQRRFPQYLRILRLDPAGRSLCAMDPPAPPLPEPAVEFLAEAAAAGRFTLGTYGMLLTPGRAALPMALPVPGPDGATGAMVVAALDLHWLAERLQARGVPPGGSVTVADRSATVIARTPLPGDFLGTVIPPAFRHLVTAPAPGSLELRSQDGTRRVLGYVPIRTGPAAGLYVSAGLSTEAAFAAIDRATRTGLLLVAVGLASAAAAALLAARLYLRPPVQRLLGTMRRWREGDTSARVGPLADRSELGRLASGFDEMADALQARTAALRESEARYHALFDASPFAVIIIDPVTHRILDFNDRTCTEYGYTREELMRMSISDIDALSDSDAIRDRGRQHAVRPGAQEFEARHRTSSGAVRDVLVRVQGVVLDGRDVTYGAHFDITARKAAEAALRESEARLRLTVEAARLGTWDYDLRRGNGTQAGLLSAKLPSRGTGSFTLDDWFSAIHPEDREATERAFRDTARGRTAHFSTEARLRLPDGGLVWIASFGAVVEHDTATGAPLRLAGIAQDITERKATEQRQVLLMREVDHRAKNALTVVQAALRLTRAETAEDYARAVEGRVSALARAHTLLAEGRWEGAALRELVLGELSAFAAEGEAGMPGGSIRLDGPELVLAPHVAQALSMALHELATNATKHGALSAPGGMVRVGWALDVPQDRLRILWEESGGPLLSGRPPARRGFGTRVLDATIRMQLGGQVTQDWRAEGLRVALELPHARQAAEVPFAADG